VSWSEPRKPRNAFGRAMQTVAAVVVGTAVVVALVALCVRAAGTPWAVPMAFAAAGFGALLVAADWRNAR
jgi:uncharacterized membrane protein YdfJ with MMPL/SSD domain